MKKLFIILCFITASCSNNMQHDYSIDDSILKFDKIYGSYDSIINGCCWEVNANNILIRNDTIFLQDRKQWIYHNKKQK